jgi:hypothetical protein
VRSPRVWELAAPMEVRGAYWKSSPKLDLKVEMRTLCSIFVEIESIDVNVMCHALVSVVRRRVVSLMRFSAQSL